MLPTVVDKARSATNALAAPKKWLALAPRSLRDFEISAVTRLADALTKRPQNTSANLPMPAALHVALLASDDTEPFLHMQCALGQPLGWPS